MPDQVTNFSYGTCLTPPSPPSSGLTLVLNTGQGVNFPASVPFDVLIWPTGTQPLQPPVVLAANAAEIARGTISGDTITFTARGLYGTTARTIVTGDQVEVPIDAQLLNSYSIRAPAFFMG